ncbi:carboxypeptidase B [Folsomia candida]|uniref:Zinc carboxypeptidase A 1 n=1 Tax=Folsomia candida TaxID=158441 RepID=A0A226CYJ5_FOLCA|nr:carboxypeptidase B [Folsomia candida]OXA37684.1 Zinc carboxypeptidase A 1 [Folsomia candida]
MKIVFVLAACLAVALSTKVNYANYKVFRITPQNEEQRQILLNLEENNPGVIFWKHVRNVGYPVDIMTPPHLQAMVEDLADFKIEVNEMLGDVQSLIVAEEAASAKADPRLSWDAYYSVDEINAFINETAAAHPTIATTGVYGRSHEGRDLNYIRLNKGNTRKPVIWVDANIHAREWITNAVCTWIIKELTSGDATNWLDNFNFVIAPMLNPDGYTYSRSTDRMWRKTRSNFAPGSTCRGADPNRNFQFDWNTGGSSNAPCSDTFMGVSALSEPEVSATAAFIQSIAQTDDLVFYLSLHSYSQLILISYGTARGRIPDHNRHMTVGNAAAAAIARRYGTQFTPGNIVELLYVASGGSGDHVKGINNPDLAYTFEMRDTGRYGFLLPPDQIIPSCLEFMDGFNVILTDLAARHPVP